MTKGGKRYANMEQDGKWFAHIGVEQSEKDREVCTSTGSMLAQATLHSKKQVERYSKINREKKTMGQNYHFSEHDNRAMLQDHIEIYNQGLGRKKCLDDRRQHSSHFCLCHDVNVSPGLDSRDHSAYQTNFPPGQGTKSINPINRRFPKNHLEQSRKAAMAQTEKSYMWFGRHDQDNHIPLSVLAAANHCSSF